MAEALKRYICSRCLTLKTISKDGFALVWTRKKEGKLIDSYLCRECFASTLKKPAPESPKKKR